MANGCDVQECGGPGALDYDINIVAFDYDINLSARPELGIPCL